MLFDWNRQLKIFEGTHYYPCNNCKMKLQDDKSEQCLGCDTSSSNYLVYDKNSYCSPLTCPINFRITDTL